MPQPLTIHLPSSAIQRLQRVADISKRSVDEVIASTIQATLPPLLENIPVMFQDELALLETLPTPKLWPYLYAQLPSEKERQYELLLERNKHDDLDKGGQQQLEHLRLEADLLMFQKAYAAVILKWRGERLPTLEELEATV